MEEKVIVKKPPKSPLLAGILSFFFPFGVGALYNRQIQKALVHLIAFSLVVTLLANGEGSPVFLGLLLAGFYFYQIIDSINVSSTINRRAIHGEEEEFTEDFSGAVKSGSIFWGIILIALGAIFLMANFNFLINYNIVFDFWPFIVIIIGIKLIVDYYSRKKQES